MNELIELKNTFIEEYSSSKILKDLNKIKSSTILISKSLFALCDYLILKKYGKLPKNHSERFRILELKENNIYHQIDEIFSKYVDTYSKPSNDENYKKIKEVIKKIIENEEFDKEIKDSIK